MFAILRDTSAFIRTCIFYVFFTIHNVLLIAFGVIVNPFGRHHVVTAQVWASKYSVPFLQRFLLGIRTRYIGLENLSTTPCILASKHESAMDTTGLLNIIRPKISYVLKKELLSIPFARTLFLALKSIPVDRKNSTTSLRQLIVLAKQYLSEGQYIGIFPEGTRVLVSEPTSFKGGITKIYKDLGVPVQPIALNTGVWWARNRFIIYPGTVTVEFLPLIPAGLDPRVMLEQLETTVHAHSLALAKKDCPPFLRKELGLE